MCNVCVITAVRDKMLSRRDLFRGAAVTGIAALGATAAQPLLARSTGNVVDLTHTFTKDFPTFDGTPGLQLDQTVWFDQSGYQMFHVSYDEHSGTHIDAPLHFSPDGESVDELPAESLVCPLCIIDISAKAQDDANAMLEPEDIEAWVHENGDIPPGACVAMNSGWAAKLGTPEFRNDPAGNLAFPGFSKGASAMLIDIGAAAIGVDTLSLDPGNSQDFAVHYSWLPSGRYGIENLANLDRLPPKGATVFVGAPKFKGGTGGPARVMAVL